MEMYRIWTVKRPFKGVIVKSSFVFNAVHSPVVEPDYKKREVYDNLPDDLSIRELKEIINGNS